MQLSDTLDMRATNLNLIDRDVPFDPPALLDPNNPVDLPDMDMPDRSHLPFVERFRPMRLDQIVAHQNTTAILRRFVSQHNIPHLLFYGPPGTGKTSTIEAFVNELYGSDIQHMVMNINASEERGIESVRNKIKNFVSTIPLGIVRAGRPHYKFVILDEADAMTLDAQGMLKQVIEIYTDNARFCLICNCNKKINPAIQSRCIVFNFPPLDYQSVKQSIQTITNEFDIDITEDGVELIWKLSRGDMRKVMHMLQIISTSHTQITADSVARIQSYPLSADVRQLYRTLCKGNMRKSLDRIHGLVVEKSYAIHDLVTEISLILINQISTGQIDCAVGGMRLKHMRDIEMNLIVTADTEIQMASIVGVFCLAS